MPIAGTGWELHVLRQTVQSRNGRSRTIGQYQVYHDGVGTNLSGWSIETKGPGDNKVMGNGRRIEAGTYPLGTHAGPHYVTFGYLVSDDPDQTPKPALEVRNTEARTGILIHPGHGFLASIGCINLTAEIASGSVDIPFVDSRGRVIAAIDDLKAFVGSSFPHYNNQPISGSYIVIDGEP